MFENIQVFEKRYEELNQKLCDPTILADPAVYAELMKEHKSITPIVEKYREYYAPKGIFENRLYEGIPELLRDLRAHGATLVVVTSKPTRFAEQIARHFGFADDFALISGSTPDGSRDAKADVIRHALATLGIDDPARAVMIGDRRHDVEGAAATGLAAIGVLWGYGSREELQTAKPAFIAEVIPALRQLLLG